jgi:1-pyrroline-5-carboxylate dehydrogenase
LILSCKTTQGFIEGIIIFKFFRKVKEELTDTFRDSAGNFYINDKSTGSVVGQQPFGGTRLSGNV